MEDKKVLTNKELEKVNGGLSVDDYRTVVCCPRHRSFTIVSGNYFGKEYGKCSLCSAKMVGVILSHNGVTEQVKECYESLQK